MNSDTLTPAISALALATACRFAWPRLVTKIDVPMHHVCIHSRHGRFVRLLEPGRHRLFGTGQQLQIFDTRLQQIVLQPQELTTTEGITVKITTVGFYRMDDPLKAVAGASDFHATLYTLIQLALRDAISALSLESLLSSVRMLGPELLNVVKSKATELGLELTELVVRDVIIPSDIKAALSESWRAKKMSLAEMEAARGKAAAARTMANAARLYETNPALLKVRYIEALEHATKSIGNTFVIGIPDDKAFKAI